MESNTSYVINLDTKFGHLTKIDVQELVDSCQDKWFNQTLCRVNDCVVRLGILEGEFHWHKHDNEDEFFYVVEGNLIIELDDQTVELAPKQGFTVPQGVMHRPSAPEGAVVLMIEGSGVEPTGD